MTDKIINKNYSGFSFEEFLQDDFFISSMSNPTAETIQYWKQFRKENEDNCSNFDAAKEYIESLDVYYGALSGHEIDEIKRNILQKGRRNIIPIRRFIYRSIGVAASIALIVFVALSLFKNQETLSDKEDIVSFANQSTSSETPSKEVRLVLSEEKTLVLDPTESEITYDTAGINIANSNQISKAEISPFNQLIVPLGKRSVLNFSDGSKIWVNSDSRLIYPVAFEDKAREIYVDGEIFIDVAPDAKRPFVVRTKNMNIQVLGTKFNVTAYEADCEKKVVLVSGSVQILSKENQQEVRLLPNQMYKSENGQSRIEQVDTRKYTSWIDGLYYCENESLSSILQRLSRYYGVEITCDQTISQVVFSGKLDLKENLTDIFDGIAFTLPISYTESNGKYSITQMK